MKRVEKIRDFRKKYSLSKIYNTVSFLMSFKGIIPYPGSKLVYVPGAKYELTFKPLEYMEEDDELIVIEDLDPLVEVLSIRNRRERAKIFLNVISELIIQDDTDSSGNS